MMLAPASSRRPYPTGETACTHEDQDNCDNKKGDLAPANEVVPPNLVRRKIYKIFDRKNGNKYERKGTNPPPHSVRQCVLLTPRNCGVRFERNHCYECKAEEYQYLSGFISELLDSL